MTNHLIKELTEYGAWYEGSYLAFVDTKRIDIMTKVGLLFLVLLGFSFSGHEAMGPFKWLEGSWSMPRPKGGVQMEVWKKKDGHSMVGKGLKVVGQDTTLLESITLNYSDNHFWYIPTVVDQNAGQPISFKLVSNETIRFVFENPAHDFPQRIIYHYKPLQSGSATVPTVGDSLYVRVESLDGKGMNYNFLRK